MDLEPSGALRLCALAAAIVLAASADLVAQRTDVVTLANGDRITGEIVKLDRGRLEFKTDDAGTLYLEWDKLASLVAARLFEIVATNGAHYLGSLGPAPARLIGVVNQQGSTPLTMADVTLLWPIGTSFWRKIDGSIDAGFNYTRSSGVAQLNVDWDSIYRRPSSQLRLNLSLTATAKDDGSGRDDRASLEGSWLKYPWRRWFVTAAGRFERNESLGLELRSQIGGAVGPRLINSNRAQMAVGAGLVVNDEHGVDVEPTQNVEALQVFRTSFFTYDRPTTNLDVNIQYYPGLSDPGRQRLELDAALKQEFWKDLFGSLSIYNSYDSRPPNPASNSNDVGIVLSIGWSY